MQIQLTNHITLDGERDLVEQRFPVEVTEKNGWLYLAYDNDEGEKVVLKCKDKEVQMTRFTTPKTTLHFDATRETGATLATPFGFQYVTVATRQCLLDKEKQTVELDYQLKTAGTTDVLGDYHLNLTWF